MSVVTASFTSDLSEFASTSVSGGSASLDWASDSGLGGTTGGVDVTFDASTTSCYGVVTTTAITSQTQVNYRFYWDQDTASFASGAQRCYLARWHSGSQATSEVQLGYNSGYFIRHRLYNDAASGAAFGDESLSGGNPDWIEIQITKATTASSNDAQQVMIFGGGAYAAAGEIVNTLSSVDCFNIFDDPTGFRLGFQDENITSGSGVLIVDEFEWNDTGAAIGPTNSAPTVTDPGTVITGLNFAEPIGTLVTVADVDSNLEFIQYASTNTNFTHTVSGTSSVSSGASGTNAMTITADNQTDLIAAHALVTATPTVKGDDTITITVTDEESATNNQPFTLTAYDMVVEATTQALLNTALATLTATKATAGTETITVIGVDAAGRTGQNSASIIASVPSNLNMKRIIKKRRRTRKRSELI